MPKVITHNISREYIWGVKDVRPLIFAAGLPFIPFARYIYPRWFIHQRLLKKTYVQFDWFMNRSSDDSDKCLALYKAMNHSFGTTDIYGGSAHFFVMTGLIDEIRLTHRKYRQLIVDVLSMAAEDVISSISTWDDSSKSRFLSMLHQEGELSEELESLMVHLKLSVPSH